MINNMYDYIEYGLFEILKFKLNHLTERNAQNTTGFFVIGFAKVLLQAELEGNNVYIHMNRPPSPLVKNWNKKAGRMLIPSGK